MNRKEAEKSQRSRESTQTSRRLPAALSGQRAHRVRTPDPHRQRGTADTSSAGRFPSGSHPGGRVVKALGLWPLQVGCFSFISSGKEKKQDVSTDTFIICGFSLPPRFSASFLPL